MTGSGTPIDTLALGVPLRIGRYQYDVTTDVWRWSDTFYRILGFEPGEVPASPSVMAAHLRPDGADGGLDAVQSAFVTGEPFSFYTRVVDSRGSERTVLLAGHGEGVGSGPVEHVSGYLVDLTDAQREASQDDVRDALGGALDHRAVIEQAKGVLMLAQSVSADEAFDLLRAYSQDSNVKVRDLAERLVTAVSQGGKPDQDFLRTVLQVFDVSR